jgi:hypothetical protein
MFAPPICKQETDMAEQPTKDEERRGSQSQSQDSTGNRQDQQQDHDRKDRLSNSSEPAPQGMESGQEPD